jgi:hypothetical protein
MEPRTWTVKSCEVGKDKGTFMFVTQSDGPPPLEKKLGPVTIPQLQAYADGAKLPDAIAHAKELLDAANALAEGAK